MAESRYGEVQIVMHDRVKVFHTTFPVYSTAQIMALQPEMIDQPIQDQLPVPEAPVVAAQPESSAVAVLPSHDYRENLHNIKTRSFGQPLLSKASP